LRPTSNQCQRQETEAQLHPGNLGRSQPVVTAIWEKTGDNTCSPSEFRDRKARRPRRTPKPLQFPKTRARQAIIPESTQTPGHTNRDARFFSAVPSLASASKRPGPCGTPTSNRGTKSKTASRTCKPIVRSRAGAISWRGQAAREIQ
jgi:hypothetical protein